VEPRPVVVLKTYHVLPCLMIEGSCVPWASPVSSNATEDLAFCGCAGIAQRKRAMLAKHARLVIVPKTPRTDVAFSNARLQFARLIARYWCFDATAAFGWTAPGAVGAFETGAEAAAPSGCIAAFTSGGQSRRRCKKAITCHIWSSLSVFSKLGMPVKRMPFLTRQKSPFGRGPPLPGPPGLPGPRSPSRPRPG